MRIRKGRIREGELVFHTADLSLFNPPVSKQNKCVPNIGISSLKKVSA
jgi:hypothetical protein